MNRHVLDQLPLWVEGDLSPQDLAQIQLHLDACPECRSHADRLRTSQAWLREALAPPFGPEDHAALQIEVLGQLAEARLLPQTPHRWRPLLGAGLAAATVFATVLAWKLEGSRPESVSPAQPSRERPVPPTDPASSPPPPAPRRATHRSPASRPKPMPDTPQKTVRIEFQTADPTVRIIWLAQAKPIPDVAPILEEP